MLLVATIAVGSVLLGAGLALFPGSAGRGLGPIRTFALTAALAVIVAQLLPDALHAVGVGALGAFLAGLAAPAALRAVVRSARKGQRDADGETAALELGFVGFLAHRFGDGMAMGAFGGPMSAEGVQGSVVLALAAHGVPVTAAFVLALLTARGRRPALIHVAFLAVATLAGVVTASYVPFEAVRGIEPWLAAVVAGLLLDVVMHDLRADPPLGAMNRTFDFFAAAAGVGLAFLGSISHHHVEEESHLQADVGRALVDLTLDTAPMLLLGLAIAAVLQSLGSRIPSKWLSSGGALRQAVRGAVVGAPIPLCSCSVLPVTGALRARGAGPAVVVAFLVSTPELGVETFALTGKFMGWPFAGVRVGAALLVAIVAALVVSRLALPQPSPEAAPESVVHETPAKGASPVARWLDSFDELIFHVGAWTALGLIVAALVEVLLPTNALGSLQTAGLDVVAVSLVSIPSYVCASSATPLAAVLLAKGFSPGAVLAGLLLGPATNLATLAFLRRAYGTRAAVGAVLALLGVTWILAWGVNRWVPVGGLYAEAGTVAHEHGLVAKVAAVALIALLARSVWRNGMRGWLSAMLVSGDEAPHSGHAHQEAHAVR